MNESWVSDSEHLARVHARRLAEASGVRALRCRHCRKAIPEGRRKDALHCSDVCASRATGRRKYALLREVRAARRALERVAACGCGEPLAVRGKGPVPRACVRCRCRAAQQRYRDRQKAARQQEGR